MSESKKLYRSKTNKMISGVCGGLAEYLNMDANIVRVIVALATLFTGGTVGLAYLVMMFVIPEGPDGATPSGGATS